MKDINRGISSYTNATKRSTIITLIVGWLFVIAMDVIMLVALSTETVFSTWFIILMFPVSITLCMSVFTVILLKVKDRVKQWFGSIIV